MSEVRSVKQGHLTFWYGIDQGTQEWLDFRKNYATCSNAGLVCDKGVKSALEANRQHATRKTPNATEYTERGHVLEDEIKQILEGYFNNDVHSMINCSFVTNDKYPIGGYSPDGIIIDTETQKFIAPVEVKCFNDWTWETVPLSSRRIKRWSYKHKLCCEDVNNIPLENRLQFEMEMLMTDTWELVVVLYNPDAEEGVPKLKIHKYTPFVMKKDDGKPHFVFRERLAERLSDNGVKTTPIDEALQRWTERSKLEPPVFG